MKILLETINYDKFKWQICGDLKVITLLLGLQQGFTKYCYFICEGESRARSLHYSRKDWPARKSLEPGIMNVENQPLVELSKLLLPFTHLKLGQMKNFWKVVNQEEAAFTYLWEKFPRLSEAKLKEGIFIGTQIRDIIKDEYFDKLLQGDETTAWDSFKFVVKVFLGNRRAQNYAELVNNLFAELPEIRMQHVTKNTLPSLAFGFFPGELLWSEWWIRRAFPSRHFFNGEEISREMKLCYARRLLLDFGNGCPYHGIQATGEKKKKIILFVLNNELTWKRLCRCSIYVVNIISTQSKSTKHVIFQWIVFSFLFNPPFRIIFQPIS